MRTHIAAGGLVLAVLALLATATPAAAQGMFSNAGDKDAGLAFTGDSFDEAYLRYYLNPRLGIQAGVGYTRGDFDDDTTGVSSLDLRVGALYEICGGERHRGYVLPSVSYTSMEFGANRAVRLRLRPGSGRRRQADRPLYAGPRGRPPLPVVLHRVRRRRNRRRHGVVCGQHEPVEPDVPVPA